MQKYILAKALEFQAAEPDTVEKLKQIAVEQIDEFMKSHASAAQIEESFAMYDTPDCIWKTLESEDVRLVRSDWVMEQGRAGRVLSRRQELSEQAFMKVSDLISLAKAAPTLE